MDIIERDTLFLNVFQFVSSSISEPPDRAAGEKYIHQRILIRVVEVASSARDASARRGSGTLIDITVPGNSFFASGPSKNAGK